jgi:hypothetical protein
LTYPWRSLCHCCQIFNKKWHCTLTTQNWNIFLRLCITCIYIFAQSKNWGARETATARQRLCITQQCQSHRQMTYARNSGVTVGSGVLYAVRANSDMQQYKKSWKQYFLCWPCRSYIRSNFGDSVRELQLEVASQRGQKPRTLHHWSRYQTTGLRRLLCVW